MTWTTVPSVLANTKGMRHQIFRNGDQATHEEIFHAWRNEAEFRAWFNALLADAPYAAFRWETPAVAASTTGRPFEFVLLDSPGLDRRPDPTAFAEYFPRAVSHVAEFANLSGDAILLAPTPMAPANAYCHLAAFTRRAPESQRLDFWRALGSAMARRLSDKPVWLNTAGAGVAWLHARLDDRPKYHGHAPYRVFHP